jgi:hypothetical protein
VFPVNRLHYLLDHLAITFPQWDFHCWQREDMLPLCTASTPTLESLLPAVPSIPASYPGGKLATQPLSVNIKNTRSCITPWPEFASELYRQSDHSLPAKLVPTCGDRGLSCGQRDGSPRAYSRISISEPLLVLSSSSSVVLTRLSGPHACIRCWIRRGELSLSPWCPAFYVTWKLFTVYVRT